jgi:hypothetical protein
MVPFDSLMRKHCLNPFIKLKTNAHLLLLLLFVIGLWAVKLACKYILIELNYCSTALCWALAAFSVS